MPLTPEAIATLSRVSTATITTVLLKKGLRNVWLRGSRPLRPGQPRLVGPAFTLRFVPAREDLATPESWSAPISTRTAIEAMPEGGRIDIAAERNGHNVLVSVDDTGPGVPAEVRQRLFQPFVTSGKNGLGLGLALSRQTVLDHGGDLWIEDDGAAGARFRLKLPC